MDSHIWVAATNQKLWYLSHDHILYYFGRDDPIVLNQMHACKYVYAHMITVATATYAYDHAHRLNDKLCHAKA
jgi:hypothetical protein